MTKPLDNRWLPTTNAFGRSGERSYSEQLRALHTVASMTRRRKGAHGLGDGPIPGADKTGPANERLWGGDDNADALAVNSQETPIGLGGYDRPIESVENVEEVAARYLESSRPDMFCAYCGMPFRSRKLADALHWFRTHPCEGEGVDVTCPTTSVAPPSYAPPSG